MDYLIMFHNTKSFWCYFFKMNACQFFPKCEQAHTGLFDVLEYDIRNYTNDTKHNAKFYQQTFLYSIENGTRFHLTIDSIACFSDDI